MTYPRRGWVTRRGKDAKSRQRGYTQRSFFSRGKAWSGDARRPFVSCASRTRNALASHGHRSRLPLTSRVSTAPVCTHPPSHVYIYIYVSTYVPLHPSRPTPRHIPPFPSVRPSRKAVLATHFARHRDRKIRKISRSRRKPRRSSKPSRR